MKMQTKSKEEEAAQSTILRRELSFSERLGLLAKTDVACLLKKDAEYGSSWKKRGGVGAFMMLARKIDRLEEQAKKNGWDIFSCIEKDQRPEGILDDIRDLRRYLLLVESEFVK